MPFEIARAKVNLYLHVTGRRADGYHELDSLAVFPDAADRLSVTPAASLRLVLAGPFGAALSAEVDNLVLRAARLLAAAAGRDPAIALTLEKNLPVASGIGGGSADAAAALRLLGREWGLAPDPSLALRLWADVPVCIASRPARMGGIGESLRPAPRLPRFGMVLVNPGVPIATPAVFAARQGGFSPPATLPEAWEDARAMARDLAGLGNDLEAPAISLQPAIGAALEALAGCPGCLLSRMSGSGATCFGLFATEAEAGAATARLERPGWWCWGGAGSAPGH